MRHIEVYGAGRAHVAAVCERIDTAVAAADPVYITPKRGSRRVRRDTLDLVMQRRAECGIPIGRRGVLVSGSSEGRTAHDEWECVIDPDEERMIRLAHHSAGSAYWTGDELGEPESAGRWVAVSGRSPWDKQ